MPEVIADNEKGLAFVGELEFRLLTTEAKLLIKSSKFIQMQNRIPSVETKVENSTNVEAYSVSPNNAKPYVGSSALLFEVTPITTETCLNCEHRERHQCGGSIIQYCGVRKSNRTYNGKLKIKCKTPACSSFKKSK